jgi:hypothetical protein
MDNEKSISINVEKLGEFSSRQDKCPQCKCYNIGQTDPPENGVRTMECDICEYHWMETLS